MNTEKYYLYTTNIEGDGILLTKFIPGKEEPFTRCMFGWSHYSTIIAWNMPLLFPTLEQIETFHEQAKLDCRVARWVSMDTCRQNIHPVVEV